MKTTTADNNFCKTLHFRCLTGFWIWFGVRIWMCEGSEYAGVTQGSEYARINSEHAWICRNMCERA